MNSISFCKVCQANVEGGDGDPLHNNTERHRFNFLLFGWKTYRKALVKDRHGIVVEIQVVPSSTEITNDTNKGAHSVKITPETFSNLQKQIRFKCIVKNKRNSEVYFTNAVVLHPYTYFSLEDPKNNLEQGKILKIKPGSFYEVYVILNSKSEISISTYSIPVAFLFQTEGDGAFIIARNIVVSIQQEIDEEEKQKSPFTNNEWPVGIKIVDPTQRSKYTDQYPIPHRYFNSIKYGLREVQSMTRNDYLQLHQLRRQITEAGPNPTNYTLFWHVILWMEEMGQMLMLQRYNMENVNLNLINNDSMLELEVPGLAEKRPSVINNDMIDIRIHENKEKCYRGTIKRVNNKTVEIAYLNQEIIDAVKEDPDIAVDVRFLLSRLGLERMHQGVDQIEIRRRIPDLFPSTTATVRTNNRVTINRFYNPLIENNREQQTAVRNIVSNTSGSVPYIVFGPPGTGKTETIVEAILQLKDHYPHQKILVCAPANAACDLLANKLSEFCSANELIRVFSETVDISLIPKKVLEYSNYTQDGRCQKITAQKLSTYNIVVTTLVLIGRYQNRYEPNIVFVDEAAQPCEPEVICALGVLDGQQIVLSGDPKQLGPFSSSAVAEAYGFGKSLLDRLMGLDTYRDGNETYITMLKLNFRSHPTVLKVANELFYEGKLKAISEAAQRDLLSKIFINPIIQNKFNKTHRNAINWNAVYKKDAAIEYCNVISEERREGRSPSYFNVQEAQTVREYVNAMVTKLMDIGIKVSQEDIGVITPYIRQVHKIKEILKKSNFDKVEVGTTETFQGREKRVIIISTVRARQDLLLYDKKYNLGFVRHDKRFNVALTRAKTKQIVIGCAHVLATDTKWMKFIEDCSDLGTTCGAPLSIRTCSVRKEIQKRFEGVHMKDMLPRR